MQYFGITTLFNLPLTAGDQPEGHDDIRAAVAAGARKRGAAGLLSRVWPAGLRAAAERRLAARMREEGLARLAETSPHLLADVGMQAEVVPPVSRGHNAHLVDDIAVAPDEVMTVHSVGAARPRALRAPGAAVGKATAE